MGEGEDNRSENSFNKIYEIDRQKSQDSIEDIIKTFVANNSLYTQLLITVLQDEKLTYDTIIVAENKR